MRVSWSLVGGTRHGFLVACGVCLWLFVERGLVSTLIYRLNQPEQQTKAPGKRWRRRRRLVGSLGLAKEKEELPGLITII